MNIADYNIVQHVQEKTMTRSLEDHDSFVLPPPPSHPPRLLTDDQILALARQGHLPLPLSGHLRTLYAQLDEAATEFFALPTEAKSSLYSPDKGTELGYVSIPGEKEYISFRASTEHSSTHFEQLAAMVWQETVTLMYRVLGDLAYGMNVSHAVWDKVIDGTSQMPARLEDATPTFLRIFRYDPKDGIAEQHTDMGLLTLCVCQGEGLQVLTKDQDGVETWNEYSEPTLLIGQTLKTLSGNLVKPGVHRVLGNPSGRGSIVFALRPSTRHEVDLSLFPGKINQDRGVVHLGELWKSIWTRAYNVNAPKEVRERQKQRQLLSRSQQVGYEGNPGHDITNTKTAFEV